MNTLERVKAAYQVIEDAAPALCLNPNDASSGYGILAHAALNCLRRKDLRHAQAMITSWKDEIDAEMEDKHPFGYFGEAR